MSYQEYKAWMAERESKKMALKEKWLHGATQKKKDIQ